MAKQPKQQTSPINESAKAVEASIDTDVGPQPEAFNTRDLLSTGSTLLNLACSGSHIGGFLKGKYYFIVGDSASGKTFYSMMCFAEAVRNKRFRKYRFIYDNIEDGCLMDIVRLFGRGVEAKIEPPARMKDGTHVYSSTIEEFYYHFDDAVAKQVPFIYVLDSMDALTSESEQGKFHEQKTAHRKGREVAGSYGDGKAKKNSSGIRLALNALRRTGSILLVLSQTRANIGFGAQFNPKTRSGGEALRFYATTEIWSSVIGAVKKKVKGKLRQIGTRVRLKVKKNRITGKLHQVDTEIFPSYGVDDIGSCIDYLVDEKWWECSKGQIEAEEFGLVRDRDAIINHIESNGMVPDLQEITGQCWNEIERLCSLKRKGRYA